MSDAPTHCVSCGRPLDPNSEQRRYCSRGCGRLGKENNRYNGGLSRTKAGRLVICCRDGTLLHYARGMMAAELGRLLRSDEIVHHINGDRADDRLENLQVVTRAEHIELHRAELLAGLRKRAA